MKFRLFIKQIHTTTKFKEYVYYKSIVFFTTKTVKQFFMSFSLIFYFDNVVFKDIIIIFLSLKGNLKNNKGKDTSTPSFLQLNIKCYIWKIRCFLNIFISHSWRFIWNIVLRLFIFGPTMTDCDKVFSYVKLIYISWCKY